MEKDIKLMQHHNPDLEEYPFSIKANPEVIGCRKEKELLLNFIKNGDVCCLTGPTGVGKSSLLLWLAKNLRGHNVFYIDAANVDKSFSIKEFLKKARCGFDRLKDYPTNSVILLDESQDCDEALQKALKLHWDHNHIKSMVITEINSNLKNFSVSFKDRIGKRIIRLGKMDKAAARELIKSRFRDRGPLDEKVTEKIMEKADYIPRKMIEFCELLSLENKKANKIKIFGNKKNFERGPEVNKQKRSTSKSLQKKLKREIPKGEILAEKRYGLYKVENARHIILTMLQKEIIQNLENDNKTADELVEQLRIPKKAIEKELKTLSETKILTVYNLK